MANLVVDILRYLESVGEPFRSDRRDLADAIAFHVGSDRSDCPSPPRDAPDTSALSLGDAGRLVQSLATRRSVLLLAQPGVGKSALIERLARSAGLECRSLLGTQIAPEDVSGIPKLVGERSVFCPPRSLLPENGAPFCLFLDELPASAPEVQKAFYSILLERRIGEHPLPPGSWVVAAGNRNEDHAVARGLSSALVNRLLVLQVRADVPEWLEWAGEAGVREEVRSFLRLCPDALCRPAPRVPAPFSTPRSWHALSESWTLAESEGSLAPRMLRALVEGYVSPEDATTFLALLAATPRGVELVDYVRDPSRLPREWSLREYVVARVRDAVLSGSLVVDHFEAEAFLLRLTPDLRNTALVSAVDAWGALGVRAAFREALEELASGYEEHDLGYEGLDDVDA